MPESKYSVVIPCYNEQEAIAKTVEDLHKSLGNTTAYELIVINDGSSDRSGEILDELASRNSNLRIFHHDRNRGYGAALKTGIRRANTDLIAISDADGTYPNDKIPELIDIAKHADMVVGSRTGKNVTYSKIRMIPKAFLRWFSSWIAGQRIPDINSGMRVFRKSIAERYMNILPNSFSFTTTITLAMLTNYYDVRYVPIDYSVRLGKSKIQPVKDTLRFLQLIVRTGMYFAPLRVFFPLVLLLSIAFLLSLCYDIFVIANLTDKTVLLLLSAMNTAIFALLADMIDKRTTR